MREVSPRLAGGHPRGRTAPFAGSLVCVGVRVRTQSSRFGAAPSSLVGSGCRVLVRTLASCKTLATLGAASDEQPEALRIEGVLFLKGKDTVVTPLIRANESEHC